MRTDRLKLSTPQLRLFFVCLGLLLVTRTYGQNKELDELARTSYVERFTNYFFIWPEVKQKSTSFSIQDEATGRKITFKPNIPFHVGAGFYMFGVGAQVLVALPASGSSVSQLGLSAAFDLQANFLGKNWGIDVFTQNYNGYYADGENSLQNGTPTQQRKDI